MRIIIIVISCLVTTILGDVLPFDWMLYNNMLDYKYAREFAFETENIDIIGDIFMRYQMNNTFGLCLLHNHFHLKNSDELLVEIVSNETSHIDIISSDNLTMNTGIHINIVPYMFELTGELHLIPMEYIDLTYSNFGDFNDDVINRFQYFNNELLLNSNDHFIGFLNELYTFLDRINRVNIFGICIKHRNSINIIDEYGSTIETNHPKERWLKIEPMIYHSWRHELFIKKWKNKEASSTFWSFPPNCQCNDICNSTVGMCAECVCGGGRCAECGCFI